MSDERRRAHQRFELEARRASLDERSELRAELDLQSELKDRRSLDAALAAVESGEESPAVIDFAQSAASLAENRLGSGRQRLAIAATMLPEYERDPAAIARAAEATAVAAETIANAHRMLVLKAEAEKRGWVT